jgi:aspartyl-tRNA(Asn)/glutamyl-tRNA(Gln) amidotransferase subunit A
MTELTDLTIAEAGDLLRKRSVSSAELVDASLNRIEQTEPVVHAYARVLAESARADATQADHELSQGHWRGPLHGVPVAVKDICYMRGIPTEAGLRVLSGFVPSYDASVVRKLQDAGAVIIGKTVTHEFAWGVNTPPTRTAWDVRCYPGGSSTGSGVSVSVRSSYGAIGTDTGGSIRVPAFVNGIVGLKPTFGRVSRYGVVPLGASLDHVGPLTRTVLDTALMLQAIAGYDAYDSGSIDEPVPDYSAGIESGVKQLTVGVERDYYFYEGLSDDVRAATEGVISELAQEGAKIVDVKIPNVDLMTQTGMTILLAEASTYHRRMLREHAAEYDQTTRLMLELGELVPATHYLTALRARARLRNTMKQVFAAYGLDAMLWPTMPMTTVPFEDLAAPRRDGKPGTPILAYIHHTFSANVSGQPALSVPCGLASDGLPIGFQLLGKPFAEATLFQIARAYERRHTWASLQPDVSAQAARTESRVAV